MKSVLAISLLVAVSAEASNDRDAFLRGCRQRVMEMAAKPSEKNIRSPILDGDRAEDLVDEPLKLIRNVRIMDESKLTVARTPEAPWSDSYWPMYRGGLGHRYNDPGFTAYDWKGARDYVTLHPANELIRNGHLDLLSPSEKYDALAGLSRFPLTESSWNDGRQYFMSYGKVESWMGLCHGWAPASFMMNEPVSRIELDSPNGKITFHPSDVKALITLLWSRGRFETRFIGGRCNSQNPARDRSGRTTEGECLDTNPGTWHLAVVNQIGVSRRPFIMDASSGYEVWNHPVFSYDYGYFNPKTKKKSKTLEGALVAVSEWPNDSRKKFRSPKTAFILGVNMLVTYGVENSPSTDEHQERQTSMVDYDYDLELDKNLNIIGGEWHSESHPDFLWVPVPGAFPESVIGNEDSVSFPLSRDAIAKISAAAAKGLPYGALVKKLVKASSEP